MASPTKGPSQGGRFHDLDRTILTLRCHQQDFENFRDEWWRYAARWRSQDRTLLLDQFLKGVEINVIEALQERFGTDKMTTIPVLRLLMTIERIAVVKQSDLFNKVRLMEARQEPEEPRTFGDRLRGLAYVCNLSTECPNQHSTISNMNTTYSWLW